MQYIFQAYKRMFDFKGKSTVAEFWVFFMFVIVLQIVLNVFGKAQLGIANVGYYFTLINLLPLLALGFRRLRDAGVNPWFFLFPIANIYLSGLPTAKTAKSDY